MIALQWFLELKNPQTFNLKGRVQFQHICVGDPSVGSAVDSDSVVGGKQGSTFMTLAQALFARVNTGRMSRKIKFIARTIYLLYEKKKKNT